MHELLSAEDHARIAEMGFVYHAPFNGFSAAAAPGWEIHFLYSQDFGLVGATSDEITIIINVPQASKRYGECVAATLVEQTQFVLDYFGYPATEKIRLKRLAALLA